MSFDNSRFTFDPRKDYAGVVMQQGRVQLDSDWNEWLAELSRRTQAGTLDTLGRAVYPATTPFAFQITASSSSGNNVLTIGPGRMYVDGLLAENHGDPATVQWDPALAEMSNTPQPPPSAEVGALDYTKQPYMPSGSTLLSGNGPFLAYLDVWIRPITYIEDTNLIDKAVGVDTTGRLQTVWQVKLQPVPAGTTCNSSISNWPPAPSGGLLTTGTTPTPPSGPCCLTTGAAYTGMENQFYRVEIHQKGSPEASALPPASLAGGIATFKWSRDNASVMTGVISISTVSNSLAQNVSQLAVQSLGRDQVLGFVPGNWIEILDDNLEFAQQPGELHQIDTVDVSAKTITLSSLVSGFANGNTDPNLHTRILRWDQSGKVYEQDGTTVWWDLDAQGTGEIPVPPAGTSLILENGITVTFGLSSATGQFATGDFWTFAARTADGSVEILPGVPPRGIHHHYAQLSIVSFPNSATDCRTKWPPATGGGECGCCCSVTVGDGVASQGQFSSINAALGALPDAGGEVCILPGRYYEHVFIQNRRDVVLRGCGWQTRLASPSLNPAGAAAAAGTGSGTGGTDTFAAVITVSASQHVQLLSFGVEADTGEAGILLDGDGTLSAQSLPAGGGAAAPQAPANTVPAGVKLDGVADVTIQDLVITASTLPAVLANLVRLLQIENNRIAMKNVRSRWPAVWTSGKEIRIVQNWLGIQSTFADREWLPVTVTADLASDQKLQQSVANTSSSTWTSFGTPLHPGGIQIAGPAQDVFVLENEIDSAGRNGITLGSFTILDKAGTDSGQVNGVLINEPGPCDTTVTLDVPPETTGGSQPGSRVVAAGKLINIEIARNRIRNTGLCGIGPAGFFNFARELEVISIFNLNIESNNIFRTMLGDLAFAQQGAATFGYGAICIPDVENLRILDNVITDFGALPGDEVCGIFVMHGEMMEISRNQVLETRDWGKARTDKRVSSQFRGGILVAFATPPSPVNPSAWFEIGSKDLAAENTPAAFLPGVPAVRIQNNVVRVPLGIALELFGIGPFAIQNNHFSCGGTVAAEGRAIAATVYINNLGLAIEAATGKYTEIYHPTGTSYLHPDQKAARLFSSGAVLFTGNVCQFEARGSRQRADFSVAIQTLDHLIFGDNYCWVDGLTGSALLDAFLIAVSLQVTSNRFQEAPAFAVIASGLTLGAVNITAQNFSTYCLFAKGTLKLVDVNNVAAISLAKEGICKELASQFKL